MSKASEIYDGFSNLVRANLGRLDIKTREEGRRRLDICATCPSRMGSKCSLCGCFLPAKVLSSDSDCPAGKWNKNNIIQL
jgi:hypothetical protein